jgi:nucleotide-binding universal stress UspA family protein
MNAILVGVDGSEASTGAVRWAARTAELEGADLKIIGVYDVRTSNYAPGLIIPQDVIEAVRQDATDAVNAAAAVAKETAPPVTVQASITDGDAAHVLLELGKDASAIVLGTRQLGSFRGLFLGSVSTSVAAHAHGRVAVIAGAGGDGPVVVGVDDSPVSDVAVAEAFRQASLRGVPLVAVHTYGIETDEIIRMSEEALEALGERLAGYRADYPDVTVKHAVLPDEPAKAVLDVAGKDASLIVVGSRGRGGFKGLLLGSTSQKVMHQAQVPVLVART